MAIAVSSVVEQCRAARVASRRLAVLDTATKNAALRAIARALVERTPEILAANALDMEAGRESGLEAALLDRLLLDEARIAAIAQAVERIVALPDPVGEIVDGQRLPNGLDVRRVRVPLGVVAVVYEARPNVTVDASALCLKSGNAIVLRGSSAATHSNAVLAAVLAEAAEGAGLPAGSIALVAGGGHEELAELATQTETIDLIIPRGGEGLKGALKAVATVPVIYAASGNCHIYVDETAHVDTAVRIVLNAKTQRPGVCNAVETVLWNREAQDFFYEFIVALAEAGVQVRGDEHTQAAARRIAHDVATFGKRQLDAIVGNHRGDAFVARKIEGIHAAIQEDWETEYLSMTLAVRMVESVEDAIEHIARYGSGHSEAILTGDVEAARAFQRGVDAACVYVNASTRFTDGGEFGMGAEIGNSTQKLHARGPIGLRELCAFKYLIEGDGHIRA
jgi:glutamate-5-semialdehyde dehydrogenase